MAGFDNFRKRSQREKGSDLYDAKADTAAQFLTVLDNFERALATGKHRRELPQRECR